MKTSSNSYKIGHVLSEDKPENLSTPTLQSQMMIAENGVCKDLKSKKQCKKLTKNNRCKKENIKKKCKKTCNLCDDGNY